MNPREVIKIKTPIDGHEVVLKAYITGKEKRALATIFLRDVSVDTKENAQLKGINAGLFEEAENLAFRTVIVSVDGHDEGEMINSRAFSVVDAVLNMHGTDYSFIVNKVNEITRDASFEKKSPI